MKGLELESKCLRLPTSFSKKKKKKKKKRLPTKPTAINIIYTLLTSLAIIYKYHITETSSFLLTY